jgi:hypothetical protein
MTIEPTVLTDAATEPALDPAERPEPSRSRRSVIGAGLAGLAGLVLGSLGRPAQAGAASGGSLIMGAANSAGTSSTSLTTDSADTALLITQTGSGTALRGSATAVDGIAGFFTSANGPGVSGVTANKDKYAVYGGNNATTTGSGAAMRAAGGQNHGLVASTASASAYAVKAINANAGTGVYGQSESGRGVYGTCDSGYGVSGDSNSGIGVSGWSSSGYGVYSDGKAHVAGNLGVTGVMSKGGGSFKIDHPLDPANKFLYHSFVESPDMKNVYDGVATLDAKGEATVTLPDWFEALNRDFRYQLTAIGQAAPDLHVKAEVKGNAFSIAGGASGQKVSWLLTGIRQDAWANAHRIPVEEEKPTAERGLYLHPTEHGKSAAKGIDAVRHAAMKPQASK